MIKAMKGKAIIRPIEASNMVGNLHIATQQDRIPDTGYVVASALDDIKVGDKVIYIKYKVVNIELESQEYIVARESDILAVIDGSEG
jgi:co-chaperonin GroES (HSP10)